LFVHLCLFFVLVMTLSNCPFSTCLTQVVPLFHFDSSHILSNSSSSELQQSFLLWSYLTEITQPCIHTCNGLFICQLYLLPDLLEETDCKEDMPLMIRLWRCLFLHCSFPSHSW
jgi:hypothetical protein